MKNLIEINNDKYMVEKANEDNELIIMSEEMIANANTLIQTNNVYKVPLAELSTLGAGVSSLLPAFRTVTETVSMDTTGLYRLANESVGDVLKVAKNGNFWGAFKTAEGKSKFVQLQQAAPVSGTSTTVLPIDPATAMMAVALFTIEQKLNEIEKMQEQIISFLEIEKEAQIETDVEMLSKFINNYKHSWNHGKYMFGDYKMVLDIQRSARKSMISFKRQVEEEINKKHLFVPKNKIDSTLADFQKKFTYYRLSLYTYSLASLLEIMIKGDFNEKYIGDIKNTVENYSLEYREIYTKGSLHLSKIIESSIEANLLKGLGIAGKNVGKVIGSIPVIKEGKVDDFLIENGLNMQQTVIDIEKNVINSFNELNNPKTGVFIDKMNDMIQIYNYTKNIYFDENNLYLQSENIIST